MIRITLLALALSTTSVAAQTANPVNGQANCNTAQNRSSEECTAALADATAAAEDAGVTGFVPLVAPALGAVAATAGLAAAAGGGSTPSTTSTVSTN